MPAAGVQKTLHQRNKSSPALSTMLHAGGLKAAAKRTAFGDVSNTANIARPSKDDSALVGKTNFKMPQKPVLLQQDNKPTSQRTAQRPLSVSGLKNILGNVTNPTTQPLAKQPLAEIQQPTQPVAQASNTRKVLAKKSTAVFKDLTSTQPEHPAQDLQKPPPSNASLAPVHRELPPRQNSNSTHETIEPQLRRAQSKYMDAHEAIPTVPIHSSEVATSEEAPAARSDGVYVDNIGATHLYELNDAIEGLEEAVELAGIGVYLPPKTQNGVGSTELDRVLDAQLAQARPEPVRKNKLAPVSEPEEYWEEEDAVENYDEEGYVTARSFKSRGENTTEGATTVLFPKATQKAKREIAAAKDLVEGSKTAEELEDEAWDTTMVAEYGDEIFQYMKDLEVGL